MNKKFLRIIMILATVFAFNTKVLAEEYLTLERDEQSSGVETIPAGEDSTYELFYNAENGRFQIVYNITSDALDEITLDLTKALELLDEYGRLAVVNHPALESFINQGITTLPFRYKGIGYILDLKSMQASALMSPSSVIGYDVVIKNKSGKTYSYKEGSLTIATPKKEETESDIIGFDGQKLDKSSNPSKLVIGFNQLMEDKNLVNLMIDVMYERDPVKGYQAYIDTNGFIIAYKRFINISKGSSVIKIKNYYYYEYKNYYIRIDSSLVDTNNLIIKEDIIELPVKAFDADGEIIFSYYDRKSASVSDTQDKFNEFIKNNYNNDINLYLIELFNLRYNTSYSSYKDFTNEDLKKLLVEISYTNTYELGTVEVTDSSKYDLFYEGLFSIVITSSQDFEKNYQAEKKSNWATDSDRKTTIGNYMDEKVNNIENGKYKETDSFLNQTISEMKNEDMSSFTFGVNIDGKTNNNYQDYKFSYYASFKMIAKKGIVIINYIDEDGNILKKSEKVEYYYYDDYETKAAIIEGYELIEIDGIEKGSIEKDETVVTYIYQFVLGEGGEEFDIVQTGKDIDYSLMSSAAITLSLIAIAVISKRKNNN